MRHNAVTQCLCQLCSEDLISYYCWSSKSMLLGSICGCPDDSNLFDLLDFLPIPIQWHQVVLPLAYFADFSYGKLFYLKRCGWAKGVELPFVLCCSFWCLGWWLDMNGVQWSKLIIHSVCQSIHANWWEGCVPLVVLHLPLAWPGLSRTDSGLF